MAVNFDPNLFFQYDRALKLDNNHLFVGRRDKFQEAMIGSLSDSAHMAIYGSRGIGKTSFGWQLYNILEGDETFIEQHNLSNYFINNKYLCAWHEIVGKPKNISEVIKQFLSNVRDRNTVFRTKFAEIFTDELIQLIQSTDYSDVSEAIKIFQDVIDKIKSEFPNKIPVLFLDEFDNIEDKAGVGQLLKSIADIKIVIIGVVENLSEIIQDHQSAERKLLNSRILLEGLTRDDIDQLYNRAEQQSQNVLIYSKGFRQLLFEYSSGFPYLIQLVGFKSIIRYLEKRSSIIEFNVEDFHAIFKDIVKFDTNLQRYNLIVSSIKNNPNRQNILFIISKADNWISKTEILATLEDDKAFNTHIGAMVNRDLLVNDGKNNIKFKDPITKAIVRYFADTGNNFEV